MSWKPEYIVLIVVSTLVDYFIARYLAEAKGDAKRKLLLCTSLIINLGLLFAFKYLNFFGESINVFLSYISANNFIPHFDLLLPVGISFYTFQTLGYTIDVFNKKIKPERHLGIFAVYVAFFPQLVAGPIERAKNLIPQFHIRHRFDYDKVASGLKQMIWGFFKKIVIADTLGIFVDLTYQSPNDSNGTALIITTIFFAFQIYCDFSGYSDIAIGAARMMGFDLMKNFETPYFSKSIQEFWRRWHISLSTWFKDYLYIPLGGNRVKVPRWYFNLFIVFTVSGFWHGANWTFVIWGALHGLYIIIQTFVGRILKKRSFSKKYKWLAPHKVWKILFTFTLVNISWIFFRAQSVSDAFLVLKKIGQEITFGNNLITDENSFNKFYISVLMILFLVFSEWLKNHKDKIPCELKNEFWSFAFYYSLIFFILAFGVFESKDFIYFQF